MAGAGYKLFSAGDVLSATDVNTYMMQQTVMVFANASARTTALSSVLAEGMVSYLQDTNSLEVYDGSAWVGATGDITGLTAGTGVAITSPSGPVPTVAIDTAVVPRLGVANTFTEQNIFNASGTSTVDLIVRATAGQTANAIEIQDSTSTVLSRITPSGTLFVGQGGSFWSAFNGNILSVANSAAVIPLVARGAASQTANLFEAQTSTGTVVSRVNASGDVFGRLLYAFTTANLSASVNVGTASAGSKGIVVAGQASQTANLQEWQNSAGTVLANIRSDGGLYVTANSDNRLWNLGIGGSSTGISWLYVVPQAANQKVSVFRGFASQTATLTEWQDSTGAVLASVQSTGRMTLPEIVFTTAAGNLIANDGLGALSVQANRNIVLAGSNAVASFGGGARVVFIPNAATVPTSNPSAGGIIYIEGGALKYRGSSGTVTTIANA